MLSYDRTARTFVLVVGNTTQTLSRDGVLRLIAEASDALAAGPASWPQGTVAAAPDTADPSPGTGSTSTGPRAA